MSKTVNSAATRQPIPAFGGDLEFLAQLARAPSTVFGKLVDWQIRANERARLVEMESHRLEDMGITREQARQEAARPFWRV